MGPAVPQQPGAARRRRKGRDPHWDNVRLVSGILVVLGHLTDSLAQTDGLRWLLIASWAMRVPVFVILAGYFSSAGPLNTRELRRLSESVLAPYLLIGLLHTMQHKMAFGSWKFFTTEPAWATWFLLSLLMWRMLLPYVAVLRYPLLFSLGGALAVGFVGSFDASFSASRTVTFLPFFVLGWKLRQGLADELLHARWTRLPAIGVLAVTAVAGWFLRNTVDTSWLAMRSSYADSVGFAPQYAWGVRGLVLLCGMGIALSFIRVIPKRQIPVVSYLGTGGLYIYLLHPLIVRELTARGIVTAGPWPEQLGVVAVAVALAAVLGSPPVRRIARPLVQPRLPWLYPREPERAPRADHGTPPTGAALPAPAPAVTSPGLP